MQLVLRSPLTFTTVDTTSWFGFRALGCPGIAKDICRYKLVLPLIGLRGVTPFREYDPSPWLRE